MPLTAKNIFRGGVTITLLLLVVQVLAAQNDSDPPPSKTPTPDVTDSSPDPTQSSIPALDIDEPFIQADLQILSGNVQRPNGMFWHNGNIYAACSGDWTIYEIDAETGSTITYIWGIRNAHTLHAEDDDVGNLDLWVPDFQLNSLVRIYRGGTTTITEELSGPWGIAAIENDFLVTNLLGNTIVRVTREGEIEEMVTGLRSPAGIVRDEDVVYVANNGSARRAIEWFEMDRITAPSDAAEDDAVQSLVTGLQNPTGLSVGPDNLLYFAYSLGTRGVVGRVDPQMCIEQGGCTNDEVEIILYTDLAAPLAGLTISPDLNLYTHTIFSPDLYFVDLDQRGREAASR